MGKPIVVHGATLRCSEGTSPSSLAIVAGDAVAKKLRLATVNDFAPMTNISPFGMCRTQANPQVASATAAAQGVLTPQPCIPVTSSPWSAASGVSKVKQVAMLTAKSTCSCQWGGSIEIADPNTTVVTS